MVIENYRLNRKFARVTGASSNSWLVVLSIERKKVAGNEIEL